MMVDCVMLWSTQQRYPSPDQDVLSKALAQIFPASRHKQDRSQDPRAEEGVIEVFDPSRPLRKRRTGHFPSLQRRTDGIASASVRTKVQTSASFDQI